MRYVLSDPSLVSYSGHCFEYLRSLAEPLRALGHKVLLVGNRGMSQEFAARTEARGLLTYWCDARPERSGVSPSTPAGREYVRATHESAIANDLDQLDGDFHFENADVLLINTLRHWAIRGVVRWAEGLGNRCPKIALVLHFTAYPDPEQDDGTSLMYADAFAAIQNSRVRSRFLLLADAQELIDEYSLQTSLPIHLAPIPHTSFANPTTEHPTLGANKRLSVNYVGEARDNKGFHLLPTLARLLSRCGMEGEVELNIQSFIHDPSPRFYRDTLASLRYPNVRLHPDQMSDSEYSTFVHSADVVLVPYRIDNYHSQTSGIFAEAIALGTPVVTSRGTWMARQVQQYGGGRLFVPDDPTDFAHAVVSLVRDYRRYKAEAVSASTAWRQFHNPSSFLNLLVWPES